MTYAEKIADKLDNIGGDDWPEGAIEVINQIIADAKRASSIAVTHSLSFHPNSGDRCIEAIRRAEVKEKKNADPCQR